MSITGWALVVRVKSKLPILCFWLVASIHFFYIQKYSVDIPFMDEWSMIHSGALGKTITFDWLMARHNEHNIFTTKLLLWGLFYLNNWNIAFHQGFNFLLYVFSLRWLIGAFRKIVPGVTTWVPVPFIFLLSTLAHENFSWAFQVQFHLSLIFFIGANYLLFREKQSYSYCVLGAVFVVGALFSFSSAVSAIAVSFLCFVGYKSAKISMRREAVGREVIQLVVVGCISVAAFTLWFSNYVPPPFVVVLPNSLHFWKFLANLVSFGFGFGSTSGILAALCFLIVVVPVFLEIVDQVFRKKQLPTESQCFRWVSTLGVLAALTILTYGRAGGTPLSPVERAKVSRYGEIASILLPFAFINWHQYLSKIGLVAQRVVFGVLFVICLVGFWQRFEFKNSYREIQKVRLGGAACVQDYIKRKDSDPQAEAECLYPGNVGPSIDYAIENGFSFVKNVEK